MLEIHAGTVLLTYRRKKSEWQLKHVTRDLTFVQLLSDSGRHATAETVSALYVLTHSVRVPASMIPPFSPLRSSHAFSRL